MLKQLILGAIGFAIGSFFVGGSPARGAEPFRLLTVEPATLPEKSVVLGLQEGGYAFNHFYIDTNIASDLGEAANLGVKAVFPMGQLLRLTAGVRYVDFLGSTVVQSYAVQKQPLLQKFDVEFSGIVSDLGASAKFGRFDTHLNVQYANLSGSKVTSVIAACNYAFGDLWGAVLEAGYDFSNTQPRLSAGFLRSGPTFSTRLGVTYVAVNDPLLQYKSVIPVIDFFWTFGKARVENVKPTP